MFRSVSRITAAAVLVLALTLSAVPVQAQPRDPGSVALDAPWLNAALAWFLGFLGGDPEPLQNIKMDAKDKSDPGDPTVKTGPCIDPYGCPGFIIRL